MNERVNALFPGEGQRLAVAGAQRPRVNDLFAPATRAADIPGSRPTLDEVLRAAVGWRPGQYGQAYLDSVLSRPAPASAADVLDGPVMPDAGRAHRDATLAALPENPGGGQRFTFLPLSTDADGTPHLAVPEVVRDLAVGGADLMDAFGNAFGGRTDFLTGAPLPAVVTPQASLALMGLMGGGAPQGALLAGGSRGASAGVSAAGSVAKPAQVGYNRAIARTPEVPQRPFAADYPGMRTNGVSGLEGGAGSGAGDPGRIAARLATDIEGRPLVAQTVVGRQVRGGPDVAFSTEEQAAFDIEALSQAITGAPTRILPSGGPVGQENMGNALGRTWATGRTMPAEAGEAAAGRPVHQVDVADTVPGRFRPSIVAHEGAGHGIDFQARLLSKMDLGPDNIRQQLFRVYDALARRDPLRAEKAATVPSHLPAGPETFGYAPHQVGKELVAENLRAYLANPNWFKSVAPDVAAQMRGIVNTDPFVSRIIQLNSAGDPVAAASLTAVGRTGGGTSAAAAAADRGAPLLVDTGVGLVPAPAMPAAPRPAPTPALLHDRYGRPEA